MDPNHFSHHARPIVPTFPPAGGDYCSDSIQSPSKNMSGSIDARDQDFEFELRPPSEEDLKLLHSVRPALESAIKTRGSQFFAEKPSHGLSGLVNQGATCYLNSLVQALFHSPDFRKRVYEWRNDPGASAAA